MAGIRESIDGAVRYLSEHPDEARYTDTSARATLADALRVEVQGPNGERVATDMPGAVGGRAEGPSPAWLFRAGLAACVASTIGMEAAREGVKLSSLEVEVDSESDDRGILGMDETVPPGPLSARISVRAIADGIDQDSLRTLVERGAARCPVYDAVRRPVEVALEVAAS